MTIILKLDIKKKVISDNLIVYPLGISKLYGYDHRCQGLQGQKSESPLPKAFGYVEIRDACVAMGYDGRWPWTYKEN